MGKPKGRGRSFGLAGIVIFLVLMALLSGLCWWLWHNRSSGVPTRVLGYELMSLHGQDMEPEFPDGSLVFLNEAAAPSLRSGDAVVYGREDGREGTLSRIVNITEKDGVSTVLLKQDRLSDPYELSLEEIQYRAVGSVGFLGTAWDFLMTRRGLLCVIVIPCGIFFLIELIQLICFARSGREEEDFDGLRRKVSSHAMDDRRENFVDVTADYTGRGPARPYRSPLRKEMAAGEPDEDVSPDSLSDRYGDLDFNPIIRPQSSSGLERVIIPDGPSFQPVLTVLVAGKEAAVVPLSGPKEISVKTDGFRIDITVAPDQ